MKTSTNFFYLLPSEQKEAQRDSVILEKFIKKIDKKQPVNLMSHDKGGNFINVELKLPFMQGYNSKTTETRLKTIGETEVKAFISAFKLRGTKEYPEMVTNLFNSLT